MAKTSPSLISTDSLLIELIIISAKLSPGSIRGNDSNAIRFIDLMMLPILLEMWDCILPGR